MKWTQNDGGRSRSKRPRQRLDCVVRAIAIVTHDRYDRVYDRLASLGRECGKRTPKDLWQREADRLGVRKSFPAVAGEPRESILTFCLNHPEGRWIVQKSKHVFAVVDGVPHDDTPPNWNACVYAAWRVS